MCIRDRTGMNLCKVNASELALATVMSAMQACGLAGYRNDGDFSVGRHLRDVLSSPIMISNDPVSYTHLDVYKRQSVKSAR